MIPHHEARDSRRRLVLIASLSLAMCWGSVHLAVGARSDDSIDPPRLSSAEVLDRTLGPERCEECHEAEHDAWGKTAHAAGFKTMHKTEKAKAIASKLGIRRIKTAPQCVSCHYTQTAASDKPRTRHGVSCESCHGPAREWMPVHDDFGGLTATRATESAEHRTKRHHEATLKAMRHPGDLYHLARRCVECHVISDEQLINTGGHAPGSDFELLSWSQGEVRHNYVDSAGETNSEAPPERRRLLWVLGRGLEIEVTLEGLSRSRSASGSHVDSLLERIARAAADLRRASEAGLDEVAVVVSIVEKLGKGQPSHYLDASKRVSTAIRHLPTRIDWAKQSALDALLPRKYRGTPPK